MHQYKYYRIYKITKTDENKQTTELQTTLKSNKTTQNTFTIYHSKRIWQNYIKIKQQFIINDNKRWT